jgi:hypothetical protein
MKETQRILHDNMQQELPCAGVFYTLILYAISGYFTYLAFSSINFRLGGTSLPSCLP